MSQNIILTGNLDMLHSLYDFKATYAKTLSFKSNEYFLLHQTNTKHKNWWEVINERGEMGYIPSNYVETVTVNPSFYIQFLENCIGHLRKSDVPSECTIGDRNEIISRLKEMKRQVEQLPEISRNSIGADYDDMPPLLFKNSDDAQNFRPILEEPIKPIQKGFSRESVRKSIENIHEEVKSEIYDHKKSDSNISTTISNTSPAITHQSVYELVESVRINTQLSHEMSRIAVVTVVQGLHELLPASVFPYLSTILSHTQTTLVDDVQIDQTHDASRLKIIFNELTSCKEDSQQRSWMLHEDEAVIKEYITELISILSNADASISRHVISSDQYHVITTLIQYYQMEVRWSIRQLLLQAFGVLCSLDKTVINIMLNSVLPGELARDIMTNPRNIPKLNYSSLLLTMVFSMGEPMPVTHYEFLGKRFLAFVLDNIEYPPDTDLDEQIPDLFLNLIISFNLQFTDELENPLLSALEERDVAKTFTEKILLLINREEDPVRIFDHEPAPPHSLLKLFNDLFSRRSTASLFYTNDIKVLIDIIVRNISDLSPGDQRRQQYLELCRRVMRNTNYEEHKHKIDEILKCFTRIFCEESDMSKYDQKLVKDISNEFPHLFK
ncbi:NCK-interacting protein with SH3 domain isoform X2 [Anoplophora glabripennis]|uniref:NCK-interacting protein with SH3 domain isoform X2 n=1 Tax=Anoplophora glabripennis TaxID=217634 RepID=UPI0008757EAB|nr:NCK-interacting protein with SH3 domain isoform X2 [Anoplophora glabripennis]